MRLLAMAGLGACLLVACSDSRPPVDAPPSTGATPATPPPVQTSAATAAPAEPTAAATPSGSAEPPIGTATMEPDGTIILNLRAEGPGVVGHGQLRYPKSHAEYDNVLKHLGGLKPGESKPVAPFP